MEEKTIKYFPGNSSTSVVMTILVPEDRDPEEYINEFLDGMLNEDLRYNSDWEFC